MNNTMKSDFHRFLETGAYCTPPGKAQCALNSARTLAEWRKAEDAGLVRIKAEPEQESFADVWGKEVYEREKDSIERFGNWCVFTEVNHGDETHNDWQLADSIGFWVMGYFEHFSFFLLTIPNSRVY